MIFFFPHNKAKELDLAWKQKQKQKTKPIKNLIQSFLNSMAELPFTSLGFLYRRRIS